MCFLLSWIWIQVSEMAGLNPIQKKLLLLILIWIQVFCYLYFRFSHKNQLHTVRWVLKYCSEKYFETFGSWVWGVCYVVWGVVYRVWVGGICYCSFYFAIFCFVSSFRILNFLFCFEANFILLGTGSCISLRSFSPSRFEVKQRGHPTSEGHPPGSSSGSSQKRRLRICSTDF